MSTHNKYFCREIKKNIDTCTFRLKKVPYQELCLFKFYNEYGKEFNESKILDLLLWYVLNIN